MRLRIVGPGPDSAVIIASRNPACNDVDHFSIRFSKTRGSPCSCPGLELEGESRRVEDAPARDALGGCRVQSRARDRECVTAASEMRVSWA